ncbi:hypothetical protein BT69DRAFT_1289012 [Atractiella rhizophila]|nr:hypothetical protein BT69DRAFT_1289012 [Atractiella rhizophila]
MLNQQVNLALDSNQALTLLKVVVASNQVMRDQQTLWVKTVDMEYKAYEKAPNAVNPGLPEYTKGSLVRTGAGLTLERAVKC